MNLLNAFGILNIINEGLDDYQEEYENYIAAHQERVSLFADWLKETLPEIFFDYGVDPNVFDDLIKEHDESKWSDEEFEPYAQHFYGTKDNDLEFEEAWKHHWMHNEHHPEFWLGEDMPYIYILEMLCDWGSFSIDKDLSELSKYYFEEARDDEEKNLSDNTKKIIEDILSKINSVLDKEE